MAVPFRIRRAEWVAGVLVLVTLATLVVSLFAVTRMQGTFDLHHSYYMTMSDGYGVAPGARVEMLGIEVGRVDSIEIDDDNRVRFQLAINSQYSERVREDSVVSVRMSVGLQTMLGGVAVVVTPGSHDSPPLEEGSELSVREPNGVGDLLPGMGSGEMFRDIEAIVANTRTLTDELAQSDSELRQLLTNVGLLVSALQKGEGTVGKLLQDDAALYVQLTDTLARTEETLKSVEGLMGKGGKLMDKSESMLATSGALISKTDAVVDDAGNAFKKLGPVAEDAGNAMKGLDSAVEAFEGNTRELSAVLTKLDAVLDELDEITRATKKVFPIRRHLDDKNRKPLIDGPTR